jgi:hypothetical protein
VPIATIRVARKCSLEQHHPEEARFEEERRQHLIGHQRADHRAGLVGEDRPVGAELVGHHDARHHAHAERDRENLQPVMEQVDEDLAPSPQPERFEHRQIAREPDRESGKDDVERHREGKLRPGQNDRIPAFEHRHHPSLIPSGAILFRKLDYTFRNRVAPNPAGAYHAECDDSTARCAGQRFRSSTPPSRMKSQSRTPNAERPGWGASRPGRWR